MNTKDVPAILQFEGMDLYPVPIDVAMRNDRMLESAFYLTQDRIKIFKIRHDVPAVPEMLQKYSDKGVGYIYLDEESYQNFMNCMKESLADKLFDPATRTPQKKVMVLNDAYKLLHESLSSLGMSESGLKLAEVVSRQSVQVMRSAPNIFALFKKLRSQCEEGFLESLLAGFCTSYIVDSYSWRSKAIEEKLSMASLLCDIQMNQQDYDILKNWDAPWDKLPEVIFNHPLRTSQLVGKSRSGIISKEIQECIECHHEMPDGSGFPRGLNAASIRQLPSIIIISRFFAEKLMEVDFDYGQRDFIINQLEANFNYPNFEGHKDFLIGILKS